MYTSYFGLNENPFSIAPDPLYLYMSEHHREALAHLKYGIKSDGGFVLLTGEVGAGKTTLCRSLLEQLPDNVVVAYILNPKVSVIELLETICDELHVERPNQGSIKQLVDRLNIYLLDANAHGRKTVLIIDEAQNLAIEVLEQLRLLTNLETNRYKLLQIVLLGQPELLQILNRQEMRQLSQRVTARCHLGALDVDEIAAYVRHRLNIAGCNRPLFPENLSRTLWRLTGGIPRLINLVCDRALLGAYVLERQQVDSKILSQAAREVLGDRPPQRDGKRAAMAVGIACLVLFLLGVGFWAWQPSLFATLSSLPEVQTDQSAPSRDAITIELPPAAAVIDAATEVADVTDEVLPQTWPMDFATDQGMQQAFADLAGLWGLPDLDGRSDYCAFALESGLSCLSRKDSLETLRNMNRPAMLTLYDDEGAPFQVVMAELGHDRALFISGDRRYELALAAIASRWFGEYLLLWQRPDIQRELLQPGRMGDSVGWLAKSLQDLGLYEVTGREVRLEGSLLGAFKHFQFSNDLTPDGILGPITLIHINTARNLAGPRLYPRGDS
ncbi:MAG: AAA family ATPase [Desulfuromonadales bacterium]